MPVDSNVPRMSLPSQPGPENGTSRYRLAVDVGGTFIDYVLLNEATGEITIEKQASTPERLVEE